MPRASKLPRGDHTARSNFVGEVGLLLLSRCVRARAVSAPWAGAVAQTVTTAVAIPFALTVFTCRAIRPGTAVGADTIVLFKTGRLAGSAFFLGLRRTAVAFALSLAISRSVLRQDREGCAAHH